MSEDGQSPNRRGKRLALHSSMIVETSADDDHPHNVSSGGAAESGSGGSETVLWERFEGVAFAVTKLYRNPSWPVFQQAAASTTEFYKDSVDAHRRGHDSGIALGRQLLCKELLSWLQSSSHPFIRRDEFINALLGRSTSSSTVPPPSLSSPDTVAHAISPYDYRQRCHSNNVINNNGGGHNHVVSDELEIFQEALNSPPGLTDFFVEECRRHAKRRTSDDDSASCQDGWNKKRIRRA